MRTSRGCRTSCDGQESFRPEEPTSGPDTGLPRLSPARGPLGCLRTPPRSRFVPHSPLRPTVATERAVSLQKNTLQQPFEACQQSCPVNPGPIAIRLRPHSRHGKLRRWPACTAPRKRTVSQTVNHMSRFVDVTKHAAIYYACWLTVSANGRVAVLDGRRRDYHRGHRPVRRWPSRLICKWYSGGGKCVAKK
jgi:hypothetical protein